MTTRIDPDRFDGLESDREEVRWDRARVALLAIAAGLSLGGIALVPAWPEPGPDPAPEVEAARRTFDRRPSAPIPPDWPRHLDPALWYEAEFGPVNEAPVDDAPEPPLTLDQVPGTIGSAVGEPAR